MSPDAPPGRRRRAGLLALVVAGGLLLGWSGVSGSRQDSCPGGPEAVLLPTAADVPDVVGLDVEAARADLEGAGVAWADRSEEWVLDEADRGSVLAQSGGACGEPLSLQRSSGGPVVDAAELPPAARQLAAERLAPAPEPAVFRVLEVPGPDGRPRHGYQSTELLLVPCEGPEPWLDDPAVPEGAEVLCLPTAEAAVTSVVLDSPLGASLVRRGDETTGWTAWATHGGWDLYVRVRPPEEGVSAPACGPASAYEVCDTVELPDGGTAVRRQLLAGQASPPYVTGEVLLRDGAGWWGELVLSPVVLTEDVAALAPAARPMDGDDTLELLLDAVATVRATQLPPGSAVLAAQE